MLFVNHILWKYTVRSGPCELPVNFFNRFEISHYKHRNQSKAYRFDNFCELQIDFWTDAHGSRPVDIHVSRMDLPAMKAFLAYNR